MDNQAANSIAQAAKQLKRNYDQQHVFHISSGNVMPSREVIISVIKDLRRITFPGFFEKEDLTYVSKESYAGYGLATIAEKLHKQIKLALKYDQVSDDIYEIDRMSNDIIMKFVEKVPEIQETIMKDVEAEFDGDPAAKNMEDIIFSYPGIFAILVYRYAHVLYELNVPYIPRIMTEYAHNLTGIDINPGATIGEYFCIDHGTGIVIGETTTIGKHVKIYQGVTLGALSTRAGQALSGVKRHPTIEDNVVIYANTTILGGETVVGENTVVAGNTFVTKSIEANSKVVSVQPELSVSKKKEV